MTSFYLIYQRLWTNLENPSVKLSDDIAPHRFIVKTKIFVSVG